LRFLENPDSKKRRKPSESGYKMKRLAGLLALFFLMTTACYRPANRQAFEDLKILEGTWTTTEGTQFNEVWTVENDSLLTGVGYSLNGTDTAFKEILKIFRIGDNVVYGALVGENDGYIHFGLKDSGRNKWSFVNPEHDYPNIIKYKLISDSVLEASTTNIRGNKEIKFIYKRVY
jgi:hypothetical protein